MKLRLIRGNALRAMLGASLLGMLLGTPAFAQYSQQWGDDFTGSAGSTPNPAYWTYDTGDDFGNGEIDWATTSRQNSYLDGSGHLVIETIDNGPNAAEQYTSAHLKTEGLVPVGPYGQVEASIQTPATDGIGESFWALGWNYAQVGWPACGEIDIMESHGTNASQSNGTIHGIGYDDYGISAPYVNSAPLNDAYHTYGIYWAPYHIQFYLDGNIYSDLDVTKMASNTSWPFNQPIYVIDSVGVGGVVAGAPDATSIFPTYMYTDYIHWNSWTAGPPAAPSALTGTSNSNSVSLSWTPSATAGATYDVYVNTTNSFAPGDLNTLEAYAVSGSSFTAYDLEPGTTYYFQVYAQNQGGESNPTNTFQITTAASGNSGPVYINCGGFTVGNYMRDLSTNPLCPLGNPASNPFPPTYTVSSVTNPAPNNVYDSYRWGPSTYTINDLNPNTLYTVRLHFCENQFNVAGGRVFNVFLNGNPVLQNFDIFAAVGFETAAIYTYTAMSDASGSIQVDTTLGSANDPLISAIDVTANAGPNNLPQTPTGLVASAISTNQIGLDWNAVSGATGYNVFRSVAPGFTPSAATYAETVSGTSVTDNVLYTGTTYYYKVAALNAAGQGAASAVASATTQSSAAGVIAAVNCGGAASGAFAVDQDFSNGTTNTFNTTIDTSVLTGSTIPSQAVLQTDREGNFGYTFSNLTPGRPVTVTLYFMENYWTTAGSRLFDVTMNGQQVLTNFDIYAAAGAKYKAIQESFTTFVASDGQIDLTFVPSVDNAQCSAILLTQGPASPKPSAPAAVATDLASGATMVNWAAGDPSVTGYNVYRGTTPGGEGATPYASNIVGVNFMDTGVSNGVTYYYKVNAVNYTGTSPMSAETSATPDPWPVPGIVQAENFDIGGEGVAYHSTATSNLGGFYRTSENIAIEQTQDVGGGYDVCYTSAGQWVNYTVNVATAGSYTVDFRISGYGGGPIYIGDANGDNLTGEVNTPDLNGWQTWGDVTATLTLPAGVQTLTFFEDGGNYNFNYMTFSYNGATAAPAAPTSLTAIPGNTQATLSWQPSAGATSYNLYRGTNSGGERLLLSALPSTSYVDTSVTNGTEYYYKVAAVNNVGTSSRSNEASVTPVPPPPSAPSGLAATAGNALSTLTWTASAGATSYNVYRGQSSGSETLLVSGVPCNSYTNTGLTNGTPYYYTVAAVNQGGVSGQSNEAGATPNQPPPAPTGLITTAGSTQATLTWTASAGATSYLVYRASIPGGEGAPAVQAGLTSTTYTDTGLVNGTTYYYTVAAVDAAGVASGMSNEASASPQPFGGSGGIAIDCGGVASSPYIADVDYAGGGTQVVGNTIDTSLLTGTIPPQTVLQSNRYGDVTYTIPGFTASGTYTVTLYFAEEYWTAAGARVFDVGINGTQVLSNFDIYAAAGAAYKAVQRSFTTTANGNGQIVIGLTNVVDNALVNGIVIAGSGGGGSQPVPSAPAGLTATPGNAQVALSWNAVAGASTYNLYRGSTAGGEGATPYLTGLTGTSYADTGLAAGAYYYKLTAVNGTGASAQSNEAEAAPYIDVTSKVTVTRGGVLPNFAGGGYYQMDAVANTSGSPIAGPIEMMISGLPAGVTVTNATGTIGGNPYFLVSSAALAAGGAAQLRIDIANPTNERFTYSVNVYSGAL